MTGFLAGHYAWLKALHIVSVIFWMAGLLYLPRLYVYHMQAAPGGDLEAALIKQERRLLRVITNPAMVFAWIFGLSMLWANRGLLSEPWVHTKLALVVVLTGVHMYYARARRQFEAGRRPRTERFWRIVNEIPAIMAVAIVILAVVEPFS